MKCQSLLPGKKKKKKTLYARVEMNFNPFMLCGLFNQLFRPVYFQLQGVWSDSVTTIFFIEIPVFNANSVEPDQTLCLIWDCSLQISIQQLWEMWKGMLLHIVFFLNFCTSKLTYKYSKTLMTRTSVVHLGWFKLISESLCNSSDSSRK